jgi:hypothetical protein
MGAVLPRPRIEVRVSSGSGAETSNLIAHQRLRKARAVCSPLSPSLYGSLPAPPRAGRRPRPRLRRRRTGAGGGTTAPAWCGRRLAAASCTPRTGEACTRSIGVGVPSTGCDSAGASATTWRYATASRRSSRGRGPTARCRCSGALRPPGATRVRSVDHTLRRADARARCYSRVTRQVMSRPIRGRVLVGDGAGRRGTRPDAGCPPVHRAGSSRRLPAG